MLALLAIDCVTNILTRVIVRSVDVQLVVF